MGIQIKGSNDTISSGDGSIVLEGATLTFTNENITGISTMASAQVDGNLDIVDKIRHVGDTDTAITFAQANTISAETGGSEALRIDSGQRLLIGHTATRAIAGGNSLLQIEKNSSELATFLRTDNGNGAAWLALAKSRSSAGAACQAGDNIGAIAFVPHDGTDLNHHAAEIRAYVDTGIGTDDTPGYLSFHTNPGGTTTDERLRIASNGDIHSVNKVQSGGNTTAGFIIGAPNTAAYIGVQSKSVANGGSTGNAAFQAWLGSSNTFRVNADGLIKTSKGVDFSGAQTNTGGMTSETLDSYEEGTFTPYIRGAGGSAGSYAQFGLNGKYTKIGNMVHFTMQSVLSNKGSYSGNFKWGGLPFTAAASNYAVAINMYPSTNVDGVMRTARVNNGQDFGYVMSGSRLDIPAPYSEIVTGYYFSVAGTYQAA